jgi:hypothetical protein
MVMNKQHPIVELARILHKELEPSVMWEQLSKAKQQRYIDALTELLAHYELMGKAYAAGHPKSTAAQLCV